MNKARFLEITITLMTLTIASSSIYAYYYFYPTSFLTNAKFSARRYAGGVFENSRMVAPNAMYTQNLQADRFNVTIDAERGWEATRLTVSNASVGNHGGPIHNNIRFTTNGSVSLQIIEPKCLFINPQNLSLSILIHKAERASFIAEVWRELLVEDVSTASILLSKGNLTIDFEVVGGSILVLDNNHTFILENEDDVSAIHLEMQIAVRAEIVATGKFTIENEKFSSLAIECWDFPISAYFRFADGFLSYDNTILSLPGSQDLELAEFMGIITLLNPQVPAEIQSPLEITMQGRVGKILVGQTDVTASDLYRDLSRVVGPFSALITALVSVAVSTSIAFYITRRKEKKQSAKGHLKEFKDELFAPILKNLEGYFYPYVRLRAPNGYAFLRGLVSNERYPLDLGKLENKVNRRLLMDLPNHFSDFGSKLPKLEELLNRYNEYYLALAKKCDDVMIPIEVAVRFKRHGLFGTISMPLLKGKGGSEEWAFQLLLGAREEDLEGALQADQKSDGLEILQEVEKNKEISDEADKFRTHCAEVERLLDEMIEDLRKLLMADSITGKCDMME